MDVHQLVGLLALGWLVVSVGLMMQSIRRGRDLVDKLAERHPDEYEALGRPRPSYVQSVRGNRFAVFLARREFEALDDPVLAAEFEIYLVAERRLVISIIASMLVIFLMVLYARYVA